MQPITQAGLGPQCDDIRYLQTDQSMDEESNTAIRQCTTFIDTRVLCQSCRSPSNVDAILWRQMSHHAHHSNILRRRTLKFTQLPPSGS